MSKIKTILGCLLIFVMVAAPLTSVGAAAPMQTTTIDVTVVSCELGADSTTEEPLVICVINLPDDGGTQTIQLSVQDAVDLGLVVVEEDDTITIIATEGQEISIDETLLPEGDPCALPEDASHPISKILADHFCGDLGPTYDDIQTLHEAGFGFGEIAQACSMALKLEGTGSLCADILYAKQNHDYSQLTLPDGVKVSNWGQLRKAVLGHEKKSSNLGSVVSGSKKNENAQNDKPDKEKDNGKSGEEHGKPKK
jgi:hypothetical protein